MQMASVASITPIPATEEAIHTTDAESLQHAGSSGAPPPVEGRFGLFRRSRRAVSESDTAALRVRRMHLTEEDMDEMRQEMTEDDVRRQRILRWACKTLLVFPLTIVFLVTLTSAVLNWQKYNALRDLHEWDEASCLIATKGKKEEDPKNGGWFRGEIGVREYGLVNKTEVVIAHIGGSLKYRFVEAFVDSHLGAFKVGLRYPCWIKRSDIYQVSTLPVTPSEAEVPKDSLYVAWVNTFFAAVTGIVLFTMFSGCVQQCIRHDMNRNREPRPDIDPRIGPKRKAYLSSAQAKFVCATYGIILRSSDPAMREWTCSICLEDNEPNADLRTVVFPCDHRFHKSCIRKWLRRGSGTCPLCNWDVKSLFNEDGFPVGENGDVIILPPSTPRTQGHEGGAMARISEPPSIAREEATRRVARLEFHRHGGEECIPHLPSEPDTPQTIYSPTSDEGDVIRLGMPSFLDEESPTNHVGGGGDGSSGVGPDGAAILASVVPSTNRLLQHAPDPPS